MGEKLRIKRERRGENNAIDSGHNVYQEFFVQCITQFPLLSHTCQYKRMKREKREKKEEKIMLLMFIKKQYMQYA